MTTGSLGNDELLRAFLDVRSQTMRLVEPLETEDLVIQSMPDASPARWHLAHVTWFFDRFLLSGDGEACRVRPEWERLLNSYYNAVGPQFPRPLRGSLSRPTIDQIIAYRREVDAMVVDLLGGPALDDRSRGILELGLNHEQQHQGLILTDLKHAFSLNPLAPAYRADLASEPGSGREDRAGWHAVNEGLYDIGACGGSFSFDNERPRHRVWLDSFEIARLPVSNAEFAEFISAGGYRNPLLWLSEGWELCRGGDLAAPLHWSRRDGEWWEFTLGGMRPLDPSAPVCHVSYFEADAYASWAGARLPSEAEWEVACATTPVVAANLVEEDRLHPRSATPDSGEPTGPLQMIGDVWEWTGSPYVAYPGFDASPGALGEYNGKFMCNQFVLRGGSCVTPTSHIRTSYRNFFPPDARWQFSGFRLAR